MPAAANRLNFGKVSSLNLQDPIMLKATEPQRKKPSRKAVMRAVASSTAVETGQSMALLEQKLRQPSPRFAHIKLAR